GDGDRAGRLGAFDEERADPRRIQGSTARQARRAAGRADRYAGAGKPSRALRRLPGMSTGARHVAIIGGGPAGLMAAEVLAGAGHRVDVYDAMPSVGRKFLLAGVGGMNITHSEPLEQLLTRYGNARPPLEAMIRAFDADALRGWI